MLEPDGNQRITNRLRSRRRGPGRFGLFGLGLIALVVVSYYGASVGLGGSTDDDNHTPEAVACEGGCESTEDLASLAAAAPAPEPPCPYCNQDAGFWQTQGNVVPPQIAGRTIAVVEASCGKLIYGRAENDRIPPASLVKMITALVAIDRAKISDRVDIKINGWDLSAEDSSTIMGLEAGMNLSIEELLYGLLLPSGNDAALTLADHLGGREAFVEGMNRRIEGLGLQNTRITNADGRHDNGQYSTAYDMALIGRELMQNEVLRRIVGTQNYTPNWSGRVLWNGNEMLYYYTPESIGVKIGWTEQANFTIVAAARKDGRELLVSVMDTWNQYGDSRRLFEWAFANTRNAC